MPKVDIDKKIELLKLFNRDVASTKEVAEIVAGLVKAVRDAKKQIEEQAAQDREETRKIASRTLDDATGKLAQRDEELVGRAITRLEKAERELLGKLQNGLREIKEITKIDLDSLTTGVYQELRKMKESIPDPVDLAPVFEAIEAIPVVNVEVEIPKHPELIRDALELLNDEDRLDKSAIKGLEEEIKELRKEISSKQGGGVRRVFQPYIDRFTAETDGVNKTFYLRREPLRTDTIEVSGTDFPIILDPTVDFTVSGKTLTLAAGVPAPSTGATLICKYYA